jgi:two-component system, LytTR family, response regulator
MIKCIVIDDEPLALDLLENFINKIPFLSLLKKCSSPFEALDVLQTEDVQLIFLDVMMPDLSGLEFAKSLNNPPLLVLTTAYDNFALEAFNMNAIDYLLKPFPYERFLRAAIKAQEYINFKTSSRKEGSDHFSLEKELEPSYIFIRADYSNLKLFFSDILYIQGFKDYVKIFIKNNPRPIFTKLNLKNFYEKLPPSQFVRIHKSYVVSLANIHSLQRDKVTIENTLIPIGDFYKEDLYKMVGLEDYC